jgi:methionyl-tRNA formyltransferase
MKIVFFGTPQFAVPSLQRSLAQPDFQVLAVVTQPDKRRGRGNQLMPSPVKEVAIAHQIPVWQPKRIKKDPQILEHLAALNADAFVVVAYGQILSQAILDIPRLGCINGHGSILPKYRGAAPIQWSIVHGETKTGITTMLMDAGMDTGAMLLTAQTPIYLFDTAQTVADRLATLSADLLIETLQQLDRGILQPIPQDNTQATYAPLIQKADYELDWAKPAIALHNQVRGFSPNCVTLFRQEPLKILATIPLHEHYWDAIAAELVEPELHSKVAALKAEWATLSQNPGRPGEVIAIAKNLGAIVQTGDGMLLLHEIQLSGKRPQSGKDFANGARVAVGEKIGGLIVA